MPRQVLLLKKKSLGKWDAELILALAKVKRFSYIRRELGITGKTLSRRLQSMIDEGLIIKAVYAEVPVRIEYELTQKGQELLDIVKTAQLWEEKWS